MARIKKLKIPAEIYVTLISSQWDLMLAFCQLYTYKSCLYDFFRSIPSQGVECYYFLSMDCQKKKEQYCKPILKCNSVLIVSLNYSIFCLKRKGKKKASLLSSLIHRPVKLFSKPVCNFFPAKCI